MSKLKQHLEKIQKEEAARNFSKWFKDGGILDNNDEPLMLYTGTLSDFTIFDITKTRPESYFGQGFYFTDNQTDASENYARREGPDNKNNTLDELSRLNDDLESFLEYHYEYRLENPDDSEINGKIRLAYDLVLNGDDIEDALLDEIFEFHQKEVFQRQHEGLIVPVFIKSSKLMDIEAHYFDTEFSMGDFDCFISHFQNKFPDFSTAMQIELEMLATEDGYYPDEDEILTCLEAAIDSSNVEQDDYESEIEDMKNYIEQYFKEDFNRCLTNALAGEAIEFKSIVSNILMDNGCDSDADRFEIAFNKVFEDISSGFKVTDFLNSPVIAEALSDLYIEVDNIYNMHVSGSGRVFGLAIQRMGYDVIKMSPENSFDMPHTRDASHYIVFNPLNIKSAIGNNGEYSLTDPDILHRVCKNVHDINLKENSISFKEASHIIKDIGLHYKNMPKCHIHTDFDDIIHSVVGKDKNIESCTGWYDTHSHSIHVYLPNIMNRKELEQTICHELFGHLSLRDIMGDNYERTMNKVYDYYESKGQLDDIKSTYVDRYNLNLNNKKDRAIIAEEKMAEVIELHGFKQFPLKNVIMGAIRNNIRKVVKSLNVTENDITYMMYQSHKNMLEFNHKSEKKRIKVKHH